MNNIENIYVGNMYAFLNKTRIIRTVFTARNGKKPVRPPDFFLMKHNFGGTVFLHKKKSWPYVACSTEKSPLRVLQLCLVSRAE
jgi:hypothetical protein